MRFGRTLVSFIGLTVMLLCAELWLVRGLAAQKSQDCFYTLGDLTTLKSMLWTSMEEIEKDLSNSPVDDMEPDWSPDGTKIAFVSDRNDDADQIYVMDSDGNEPD